MEKDLEERYKKKKKSHLRAWGSCFEMNELGVFDFFYLI